MPASSLGPHVVGTRIVVRRLLPGQTGPTGGPALTDVLGVCTSWSDGMCVVESEDGASVEIPLELIVSGKPVPPRPSSRLRVSVREAELRTEGLFATVTVEPLGDWQLRFEPSPDGRLRKRANSCLAMSDPALPLAEAAAQVVVFYTERGRRPMVQVERESDIEASLRSLGWTPVEGGDSHFLLGSLARAQRTLRPRIESASSPIPEIVEEGPRLQVRIGDHARGEARIDGDWLGIHNLSVDPTHRRRGLAKAVLFELLTRGAEQGATTAWLHVETTNEPAMALYEGLGFAVHHSCRYLEYVAVPR